MRNLGLLLLLAGCTRPALSLGEGDGGTPGDCSSYSDAASCAADPACTPAMCGNCNGGSSFAGCVKAGMLYPCPAYACPQSCHGLTQSGCAAASSRGCHAETCCGTFVQCLDPNESFGCTALCASCDGLDEKACLARSDCRANYCPGCGDTSGFAGCQNPGEPPPECPAPPPSCQPACSTLNFNDCTARADCHNVFAQGACGCAACCCMAFSHCASAKADCKGPALCNSAPPNCDTQLCNAAYVVSYANGCYDGCVLTSACQ
jgi:hypothetical protein